VAPVVVRLAAPAAFTVTQPATAERAASSCQVERAQFDATALRGDTLYFEKVVFLQQAADAEPCAHGGAGYVVMADHPEIRSERMRLNWLLTSAGALSVVPAMVVILFFAAGTGG
jgi:hypothetical protein